MSSSMQRYVLLSLALCSCTTTPSAEESSNTSSTFEVECIGMAMQPPSAGFYLLRTRFGGRCNVLMSDTVWENELAIMTSANFGQPNTVSIQIEYAGETWVANQGSVRLDVREEGRGQGSYDVTAVNENDGRTATIKGPFDFCDYAHRTDCPYTTQGGLSRHVSFTDPDGFSARAEETFATECRVLIDPATQGVRVDLQIGVFNGVNVARWQDQCDMAHPPPKNHFIFQAGGVTGPGTFGPFTTATFGESTRLPGFEFTVPHVYYGWGGSCLSLYSQTFVAQAIDGTRCTWTIEESPGRFAIDCEDAQHYETWSGYSASGDFTLRADCDVRYR